MIARFTDHPLKKFDTMLFRYLLRLIMQDYVICPMTAWINDAGMAQLAAIRQQNREIRRKQAAGYKLTLPEFEDGGILVVLLFFLLCKAGISSQKMPLSISISLQKVALLKAMEHFMKM